MVLIYNALVCYLAAFYLLTPKTAIAKFLAAAVERVELMRSCWSALYLPRCCLGLLLHRLFQEDAILPIEFLM